MDFSIKRALYNLVVDSQIWVSICAMSLAWYYQIVLGIYSPQLLYVTFFSTLAAYNLAVYQKGKCVYCRGFLIIVGLVLSAYFSFSFLAWKAVWLLLVLGGLSLFYSFPWLKFGFRRVPMLKIFLIAFVWAGTIIIVPTVNDGGLINPKIIFFFIQVFLFVIGITIPFDIRDLADDDLKLMTIPQKWDIRNSKIIAIFCLILSGLLLFYLIRFDVIPIIGFVVAILYAIFLVFESKPSHSFWYYGFWLEGVSMIPLIISFLLFYLL